MITCNLICCLCNQLFQIFSLMGIANKNNYKYIIDKTYSDKYQYLDDLLDKTYLIDYFLVHDADNPSVSNSATTNK